MKLKSKAKSSGFLQYFFTAVLAIPLPSQGKFVKIIDGFHLKGSQDGVQSRSRPFGRRRRRFRFEIGQRGMGGRLENRDSRQDGVFLFPFAFEKMDSQNSLF